MTVPLLDGVDWEIVGLFAALVLLEGLRRVPAGALVVRATGWSGWKPAGEAAPGERWRLVSWWSPLAPALVLPALAVPSGWANRELAARVGVARRAAPWLGGGAVLTLSALILGLPIATARLGGVGFLAAAGFVLALALGTAAAGAVALRRLDPGRISHRRQVLGWCSPFASGRVIEGVYQAAVAGASQAQAFRALAGERVFADWARPRAYDVVRAGAADPDLTAAADAAELESIVASVPWREGGGRSYCPRCGATLLLEGGSCPDCAVPLVRPDGAWTVTLPSVRPSRLTE
ncbi:MAG: hypothetical protein ACREM9_01730 [Gemmatimonadales bacterium]